MSAIFFASTNQHKIAEIRQLLAQTALPVDIVTLLDKPELSAHVVENGSTYQENSLIKARTWSKLVDMPVLTDDSGIEVTALPGLLGVHSARWFAGSDADRVRELLRRLHEQPDRRLTYHCVLCLLAPKNEPQFFAGELHGSAALAPRGQAGFGYDPIFIPDGYQQTVSELGQDIKNNIGHRRQALDQLVSYLKTHS